MKKKSNWIPEILYEEDNGLTQQLPFIPVPPNEEMPKLLFIFESRETGEYEPDEFGNESPIVDLDLHQYVNMNLLKSILDPDSLNSIRKSLGLEPR
jgi:hypothetical protein